jgi:uncharacterized protein
VRGVEVEVDVTTEYPFDGNVDLTVRTTQPLSVPLHLRVPAWAAGARLHGPDAVARPVAPGTFVLVEHEWQGETRLTLEFPLTVRAERRYNDAVTLSRGPLLLALQIGEAWRQIGGELPAADWEVLPTTAWAYALDLDPENPEASLTLARRPLVGGPFSPGTAPLVVRARGRRVPEWGLERGAAAPPPPSPVRSDQPLESLTLLPYGATGLRVGEMPVLGP